MLNHIWLALIVIGILTAAGRDVYDISFNTYGNGIPWDVSPDEVGAVTGGGRYQATIKLDKKELRSHFPGIESPRDIALQASITMRTAREGTVVLTIGDDLPAVFAAMAVAQGGKQTIAAQIYTEESDGELRRYLLFDPVKFVYLKKVTNAAFDAANLAVQIAIGLIGIMALWLGVMKVAEEAGLITHLARLVKPITVRLFPDVPPDHPAIGAIIMNISANMLGLGNAATPFGLKAMEELNRLNPKAGVATNAMCMFLAMNTSCITLIPATAIAVRAATGSADPAMIIGTSFLASLTATIAGITTARILQNVKMFRIERSEAS